MVQYTHIIKIK